MLVVSCMRSGVGYDGLYHCNLYSAFMTVSGYHEMVRTDKNKTCVASLI
jgi:hypothetical protein